MMTRLYVGNFDFEHRLGPQARQQLSASVERINEELAASWIAVAEEGDRIWTPAAVEPGFFEELASLGLPRVEPICDRRELRGDVEVIPWGWTRLLHGWVNGNGWRCPGPDQEIVEMVNSRRFSFRLETEWGSGLVGQRTIESTGELLSAISTLPAGCEAWVVKAEFSMSARERIVGRGKEPSEQQINWVRKRLSADGIVFFEPWVERIEEASLQFTIPHDGSPVLEGVVSLLTDRSGNYRGNRLSLDVDLEMRWMPAIEIGTRIAQVLRQRGYFGPLGIDALRYRDTTGSERIRSLGDINARHTMGRLAMGFRRLLQPGECATWFHVPWSREPHHSPQKWFDGFRQHLPAEARVLRTSPFEVGGSNCGHGTFLVISENATTRSHVERQLVGVGL